MSPKISMELVMHRLDQAKEELKDAKLLYNDKSVSKDNWKKNCTS